MPETKLILLGTGLPHAVPDRWGPALAIVAGGQPYIVDFGPGVVHRVLDAGLDATRLTRAFLTHLHSDHTVGYPDLILTPWLLGRNQPLEVYGPKGLNVMTYYILNAYQEDIRERSQGLQPSNQEGYKVNSHEVEPGIIYRDDNLQVEAFPVEHGSWQALGYKFIAPDKTIVISSDAAPSENLINKAKGCDILVHEVYSEKGFATRSEGWQRYHQAVHTSSSQLAEIASRIQPGLLILYHQLFWGTGDEELVSEVKQGYRGQVVSGRDLEVY